MASTHSSGGICLANFSLKTLGVISSKKKLLPTTFRKMSRPKASTYFGRYHPKHRICFENTFWGACLKTFSRSIGGQMSPTFPWRIFWEISPTKWSANHSPTDPWFFFSKYLPRPWKNTLKRCWTVFENGFGRHFRKKNITSGICWELLDDRFWEVFLKIFLVLQGYVGDICPSMFLEYL